MATATIVWAWQSGGMARLAVRVAEANGEKVEYIGSVAVEELAGLTAAERKAKLVAAVKAERDRLVEGVVDLGMTGTVSV